MQDQNLSTPEEAYLHDLKARVAALAKEPESGSRNALLDLFRDLERGRMLLEQAVQQTEGPRLESRLPTLIWRYVQGDFVLVRGNHASREYLKTALPSSCPSVGERAASLCGRHSTTFSRMMTCYSLRTAFEVDETEGFFNRNHEKEVLTAYSYVSPDLVMIHLVATRPRDDPREKPQDVETKDRILLENAEQEIRELKEQIVRSEENERRKISWLLHDELLQELAFLKMSMEALVSNRGEPAENVLAKVKDLSKIISRAIKATRSMSQRLHPSLLDRFGPVVAIQDLCSDFRTKAHCRVDFSADVVNGKDMDPTLAITLYRLVDEAFRNIRKHAQAERVTVRLSTETGRLHLLIQDDGLGFDPKQQAAEAAKGKHLGMSIMRERTTLLNGDMAVETGPNSGTSLQFVFPWAGGKET